MADLLLVKQFYKPFPYSPFQVLLLFNMFSKGKLLYQLWVLTPSLDWVCFLVFVQRKRQRSLTVGNGSGVSVCPPMGTAAWERARAPALGRSASKPPRLRSVKFPATGRSNLEVSIAVSRGWIFFFFLKCLEGSLYFLLSSVNVCEGGTSTFQVHCN